MIYLWLKCLLHFCPVIILKTYLFKSSILFAVHNLFDKSLRVLQLPTGCSTFCKSTVSGFIVSSKVQSHVITESSIIFNKYLPFSKQQVARLQIQSLLHELCYLRFLQSL